MNRFEELKGIFQRGEYFKVVCGAGNEDPDDVRLLSFVYTLAGAVGIDVSANVGVVKASVDGINEAYEVAEQANCVIKHRPFINVSIGIKGDPHVRKALIDSDNCSLCEKCIEGCEQNAIVRRENIEVLKHRCIGCGKCADLCKYSAIDFEFKKVDFDEILPLCIKAGAETMELHAVGENDEEIKKDWMILNNYVPNNYVSICLDRSKLSNERLIQRIKWAKEIAGDRMIVQADGAPMSGSGDDYNTTLQAIAIADIIQKEKMNVMLLLSGGTNSKTGELARLCNIVPNGVAIGTFARKLIKEQIRQKDLKNNRLALTATVQKAKWLIDINLKNITRQI